MAQLSYELMTAFYKKSREALAENDYSVADVWNLAESAVNNVHHGRHPAEWLPQVRVIFESHLTDEAMTDVAPAWEEAIEFIDIASALIA